MIETLAEWWRAGEEGAVQVYRQGFSSLIAVVIACLLLIWLGPPFRGILLWPVYFFIIFRGLIERRRAIIFSRDRIIYRPAFARPQVVPLADIDSVTEGTAITSFLFRGHLTKGLVIHLRGGKSVPIPLDFPDKEDIAYHIRVSAP